jgi:hypothetical protein
MEIFASQYKRRETSRKSALPLLYFYSALSSFELPDYSFLRIGLNRTPLLPKTFWEIGQDFEKYRARFSQKPAYNRSDSRLLFLLRCSLPSSNLRKAGNEVVQQKKPLACAGYLKGGLDTLFRGQYTIEAMRHILRAIKPRRIRAIEGGIKRYLLFDALQSPFTKRTPILLVERIAVNSPANRVIYKTL